MELLNVVPPADLTEKRHAVVMNPSIRADDEREVGVPFGGAGPEIDIDLLPPGNAVGIRADRIVLDLTAGVAVFDHARPGGSVRFHPDRDINGRGGEGGGGERQRSDERDFEFVRCRLHRVYLVLVWLVLIRGALWLSGLGVHRAERDLLEIVTNRVSKTVRLPMVSVLITGRQRSICRNLWSRFAYPRGEFLAFAGEAHCCRLPTQASPPCTMKRIPPAILFLSATAALGYFVGSTVGHGNIRTPPSVDTRAGIQPSSQPTPANPPGSIPARPGTDPVGKPLSWSDLESSDLRAYGENLRRIGCPDRTVRNILRQDLQALYDSKRREVRQRFAIPYWTRESAEVRRSRLAAIEVLDREEKAILESLFGPGVLLSEGEGAEIFGSSDPVERRSLAADGEKDAALAEEIRGRQLGFEFSQTEFDEVVRLEKNLREISVQSRDSGNLQHLQQIQDETDAQLQELLGPDRWSQYERAGQLDYQMIQSLAESGRLPSDAVDSAFEHTSKAREEIAALFAGSSGAVSADDLLRSITDVETRLERGLRSQLGEASAVEVGNQMQDVWDGYRRIATELASVDKEAAGSVVREIETPLSGPLPAVP